MAAHKAWRLKITSTSNQVYTFIQNITLYNRQSQNITGLGVNYPIGGYQNYETDKAFDGQLETGWQSKTGQPWIVGKIFDSDQDIATYQIQTGWFYDSISATPKYWEFQFSDNTTNLVDGDWLTVSQQTEFDSNLEINEIRGYYIPEFVSGDVITTELYADTFSNQPVSDYHKAYRLYVTESAGSDVINIFDFEHLNLNNENIAIATTYGTSHANESAFVTTPPDSAFTGSVDPSVAWNSGESPPWIIGKIYYFDEKLQSYRLSMASFGSIPSLLSPKSWRFEYSDDTTDIVNGTWRLLDEQKNIEWLANETKSFNIEYFSTGSLSAPELQTDISGIGKPEPTDGELNAVELNGNDLFESNGTPIIPGHIGWRLKIEAINLTGPSLYAQLDALEFYFEGVDRSTLKEGLPFENNKSSETKGAINLFTATGAIWESTSPIQFPVYIGSLFKIPIDSDQYRITAASFNPGLSTPTPQSWSLEISNNSTNGLDGDWDVIDIQSNITSWSTKETKIFALTYPEKFGDISALELETDVMFTPQSITLGDVNSLEIETDTLNSSGGLATAGNLGAIEQETDSYSPAIVYGPHLGWRVQITESTHDTLSIVFLQRIEFKRENGISQIGHYITPGVYGEDRIRGIFASDTGFRAADAFNLDGLTTLSISPLPAVLGKKFDVAEEVVFYSIRNSASLTGTAHPKSWNLQYSDNPTNDLKGGDWVTMHSVTNETDWQPDETKTYNMGLLNIYGALAAIEPRSDGVKHKKNIPKINSTSSRVEVIISDDYLEVIKAPVSDLNYTVNNSGNESVALSIPNGNKYLKNISSIYKKNGIFRINYINNSINELEQQYLSRYFRIKNISTIKKGRNITINMTGENITPYGLDLQVFTLNNVINMDDNMQGNSVITDKIEPRINRNDEVIIENITHVVSNLKFTITSEQYYMNLNLIEVA